MKKVTWKTEKRKIDDLKAADYNPRKMTEEEERNLADSIDEFGSVIPVVVNVGKRDNVIIGGHQRTSIYKKRGVEEVDVMVPSRELTKAEEKRLNLRLNKNTGSWDFDKLKGMDIGLLLDVGFGDDELQHFFDDVDMIDDDFDAGGAALEIENPETELGDVIELGNHRLMCGNPADSVDVDTLMKTGEIKADMLHITPPKKLDETFLEALEEVKTKEGKYAAFLEMILENALAVSRPNAHVFMWTDDAQIWLVQSLFREKKITPRRVCMWLQKDMKITANVAFNKAYEPCVYGTKGKKPYLNTSIKNLSGVLNKEVNSGNQMINDIIDALTLWPDRKEQYEKGKPVTLMERPIKRCTAPGQTILDLFGGTGEMIIAAEQTGRNVCMMQTDPAMCDAIVKRWEEFTNNKAKRI